MGQHGLIPVHGIHLSCLYADVVVGSEVVPSLDITGEDVVGKETVKGILLMGDMGEVMILGIRILGILLVV